MTYMGQPYYPEWLDNLADDVTLEAAAMDGSAHGPADVRSIVVAAKELYDNQQFSYAGPCGDNGFLEVYTTDIRGVHTRVIVLVNFNDADQTQQIVVNPAGNFNRVEITLCWKSPSDTAWRHHTLVTYVN